MLLIRTYIAPSEIHGIGLFAADNIQKGVIIWQFNPEFDLELTEQTVMNLADPAKEQTIKYAYFNDKKDRYILCSDDARFLNHSENPNTDDIGFDENEGITVANRDIKIGEEITSNYSSFHKKDGVL